MSINWLLIITVILLIAGLVRGWRRGFLRVVFSLVALLLLILLASFLTPHITTALKTHTKLYDRIEQRVENRTREKLGLDKKDFSSAATAEAEAYRSGSTSAELYGNGEFTAVVYAADGSDMAYAVTTANSSSGDADSNTWQVPQWIEQYIEKGGLSTDSGQYKYSDINGKLQQKGETVRAKAAHQIASRIASLILSGLSFVIALIIGIIIIKLIERSLEFVNDIPVIGRINRVFGVFAGVFESLLIIWLILLVISLIASGSGGTGSWKSMIDSSRMLTWLNEHNLITWIWHYFVT